ncbi:hypothetical protein DFJ73DRAFT_876659 [Zopfochytrium polystomum]|nr:hypothetical protein DFJ73DRAFT_876659 [Zopfochytrium polystomum]
MYKPLALPSGLALLPETVPWPPMNTLNALLLGLLAAVIASLPIRVEANPFLLLYTMATDEIRKLASASGGMNNDHNLELNELVNHFFLPLVKDCSIVEVQTIVNHFNSNSGGRTPYIKQIVAIINHPRDNSFVITAAANQLKKKLVMGNALDQHDPGKGDLAIVWDPTIRGHRVTTLGKLKPVLDAALAGLKVQCIPSKLVVKFEKAVNAVTDKIDGWLAYPRTRPKPYATYKNVEKALKWAPRMSTAEQIESAQRVRTTGCRACDLK